MDRTEELRIAAKVLGSIKYLDMDIRDASHSIRQLIDAELDALNTPKPKRWQCQIKPKDTLLIEPCAVRSGLVAVKVYDITQPTGMSVRLLPGHALEAGYELIRLGNGGEMISKAAVIALLTELRDRYSYLQHVGHWADINKVILELEAGNVK
jgi:hypothetical protein